jgi:uncharacterized protein (DUF1015 family)
MSAIYPFAALRPTPKAAGLVASVPYDVVSSEEARALASGNPLSFLHVSRPEIDMGAGVDPHSDAAYQQAARAFATLKSDAPLVVEEVPSFYVYRLKMGNHVQSGIAAGFSIDEYERDLIKKHEKTRPDKEDDRTRHMLALGAQTGPVFLTYRATADVDRLVDRATAGQPLFDFEAVDGVHHTIWRIGGADRDALVSAFAGIPTLYIADGHHRAASAARARTEMSSRALAGTSLGDGAGASTVLAVAFPHDQVQILPYNRSIKDLNGLSPEQFLQAVADRFDIAPGPPKPARRGEIAMYFQGQWQTLHPRVRPEPSDPIGSLDVSVLQEQLLVPVLKIADVRTDKRIDFVGGARGTGELQTLVDTGKAAVAFSLYPVRVSDLMAVSDAGAIMPPKSTWFEPKLRDGLLIHVI